MSKESQTQTAQAPTPAEEKSKKSATSTSSDAIIGIDKIGKRLGLGNWSILQEVANNNFPAIQNAESVWVSSESLISAWETEVFAGTHPTPRDRELRALVALTKDPAPGKVPTK
jgi:hypothetical protein